MKKIIILGCVSFILMSCLTTNLVMIKPLVEEAKPRNIISFSCMDGRTKFGENIAELLNHVETDIKRTGEALYSKTYFYTLKLTFYQKNGDVGSLTLAGGLYTPDKNGDVLWYEGSDLRDGYEQAKWDVQWDGKLIWLKNGELVKLENNVWSWVDQAEGKGSAQPFYKGARKFDEEDVGNRLELYESDDDSTGIRLEASQSLW